MFNLAANIEACSTATGAASIKTSHYIALLCQHVEPVVVAISIAVGYLLVAGAAIDIEKEGVTFGGIEVGRQYHIIVQFSSKGGGEGAELLTSHTVFFHSLLQVGVVLKGFKEFAIAGVKGVNGRGVGISESADVIFACGAEACAVPSGFLAQLLFLFALKID